ncbi:MAG: hypothetical protein AAF791_14160, partial [Bacteroidota bacterium]
MASSASVMPPPHRSGQGLEGPRLLPGEASSPRWRRLGTEADTRQRTAEETQWRSAVGRQRSGGPPRRVYRNSGRASRRSYAIRSEAS